MKITEEMKNSGPFQYAYGVLSGKIITGNRVKQAVNRFFSLIEESESKGYVLDHEAGMKVINFFPLFLKHTAGDLSGTPFYLEPHQQFTYYNILAWQRKNRKGNYVRLYRTVYEKVARKNGKTAGKAGLGIYLQGFDNEFGADVRVGATMEKQARILWDQAANFIKTSELLKHFGYKTYQSTIKLERNLSVFAPVSKESKTLDGLRPSVIFLDEYHAHPTDDIRNVLQSGMGSRSQPLLYIITTAGVNPFSVCKQYEDVCKLILDGELVDDSTFVMIHDLDDGDDWEDKTNWYKANPNIGKSIYLDFLEEEFIKAKNQPSLIPNFKTKHLNMWVDAVEIWIPSEIWKRNEVDEIPMEVFQKYGSYSGLDMSTNVDFTAWANLSEPDENDIRYLNVDLFCPEFTIDRRSKEDRVPYRAWRDAGYIISTPGDMIDHRAVFQHIIDNSQKYNNKRIEIDKHLATQITADLMDAGIEVSWFSQGLSNYNVPTKEFERLIYQGKIKYKHNPVLEWMLSGCSVKPDSNENIRLHKGKSHAHGKRIDGIIASIMALGGSLSMKEEPSKYSTPQKSIYV